MNSSVIEVHQRQLWIDSQSVKIAAMVHEAVGYDAGKKIKGRKQFLTVATLGLLLRVLATAANAGERFEGKQVFQRVKQPNTSILFNNHLDRWKEARKKFLTFK